MPLFPQDNDNKPSIKKIIIYSVAIFVLLIVLGMINEHFGIT